MFPVWDWLVILLFYCLVLKSAIGILICSNKRITYFNLFQQYKTLSIISDAFEVLKSFILFIDLCICVQM